MRATLSVVAGALAIALTAAPAVSAAPQLPIGHAGRWMTDAQGRVAILHGLNMVSKRPPYAPDATGFGDDDASFLASEGYNTVRVGIIYKAVEPAPGVYDDAYLDRIRDTVDTLGRHGIVSLLDFHQDLYNERFQGEGWPDWAIVDDGLPAEPKSGFPNNYLVMPALQRAFDHFWADDPAPGDSAGLQDRYAAAWRHVAERFRDDANVMGYDLLNEPWPGTAWQECANPAGCPVFDAKLTAFSKRTIAAIREADPRTLAFYEPNVLFNNGPATHLADTGDAQAGMSFHDYCLNAESGGANANCQTQDDLVFTNADSHARETGDTLMLTEFGATPLPEILGPMTDRADRFMVSWQEWHYCGCDDPTTSGPGNRQAIVIDPARPPAGDNLDTAKLKLLSRPYPQLVAGTPTAYGFDAATTTFTLNLTTKRADGTGSFGPDAETEIAVPRRQYPSGYAAEVRGGRIASPPGDGVLRVAACPGASAVSVAVRPTGTSSSTCAAPVAARLRVTVSPRRIRVGRRATVHVRVTAVRSGASAPLQGAIVRLARERAVTDRRGRAQLVRRFARRGALTVTATARGYLKGRASIVVVRRRTQAVAPVP